MAAANPQATPAVTGPFPAGSLLLLHRALDWWQAQQFHYVDLPWVVPKAFSDATRPAFSRDIATPMGSFVASGEQSFLQLWSEGRLPAGARGYIGWTPCLRDEILDDTHQHGFMKAEWFVPLTTEVERDQWWARLDSLLTAQATLFRDLGDPATAVKPVRIQTDHEEWDLRLNGLEIGSYGLRYFDEKAYLYGTALALPRFYQALAKAPTLD